MTKITYLPPQDPQGAQWGTPGVPAGYPWVKAKLSLIKKFHLKKFLHMLQGPQEPPHSYTPDLWSTRWGAPGVPMGRLGVKAKLSQIKKCYQYICISDNKNHLIVTL